MFLCWDQFSFWQFFCLLIISAVGMLRIRYSQCWTTSEKKSICCWVWAIWHKVKCKFTKLPYVNLTQITIVIKLTCSCWTQFEKAPLNKWMRQLGVFYGVAMELKIIATIPWSIEKNVRENCFSVTLYDVACVINLNDNISRYGPSHPATVPFQLGCCCCCRQCNGKVM